MSKQCIEPECTEILYSRSKRCDRCKDERAKLLTAIRKDDQKKWLQMKRWRENYDTELKTKANIESLREVRAMKKTQFSIADFQDCHNPERFARMVALQLEEDECPSYK